MKTKEMGYLEELQFMLQKMGIKEVNKIKEEDKNKVNEKNRCKQMVKLQFI